MIVLALSVGLLGLLPVGSAQAVKSEWMIEGKTISELKLKEEEEKDSLVGGSLSLSVPSKKFTIECKEVKGTGEIDKGGFGELSASLSKCEIPAVKTCKVSEPLTLTAKYTTLETGGKYYAKVEGVGGKPLMTVVLLNEECPLPPKAEVKGSVAAEFSFQPSKKQSLKFSESISKKVNEALVKEKSAELQLTYGLSLAFLGGESILELSGGNKGLEWSLVMGTQLCNQRPAAGTNACAPGQVWEAGTFVEAKQLTGMKFTFGMLETTCATSNFQGNTKEMQGTPL